MGAIYTNGEFYGGGSPGGGGSGGDYVLPPATSETLGGVKIGDGLSITENGLLSAPKRTSHTFDTNDFNISEQDKVSLDLNQKIVEITEADYNELTEEEKNNGTTYFIKDKIYDNSKNISYSTTPHKIGTWIDGSDVFEQTVHFKAPTTRNTDVQYNGEDYNMPMQYIDLIVDYVCMLKTTDDSTFFAFNYFASSSDQTRFWMNRTGFRLYFGIDSSSPRVGGDCYLTYRFTLKDGAKGELLWA